jgi:hypothetical protein
MADQQAIFIPEQCIGDRTCALLRNIAAVELVGNAQNRAGLGAVLQLPSGTRLQVCGHGFNDRTVKVRCNDKYYFVFSQDLALS